jgi:hypothetical protein
MAEQDIRKPGSGDKTGADQDALETALDLGHLCGGWGPKGRKSEKGARKMHTKNFHLTGGQKCVQWIIGIALLLVLPSSVQAVGSDDSDPCLTADPTALDEVYSCYVSQRHLPDRAHDCHTMTRSYRNLLTRRVGYSDEQAESRLPTCELLARVAEEIYGKPPYWAACTGYGRTEAKEHLKDCLSSFIPGYYGSKEKLKRIVGCQQVRDEYKKAVRAASPGSRRGPKLPSSYEPPSCEDANALVAYWSGQEPRGHPCAGFDADNIAGHVVHCFSSSPPPASLRNVRNCVQARRAYEQRLREAYGDLPPGYTMVRCSELKPVLALAQKYREEAVAKEKEKARRKNALARQRAAEAEKKVQKMLTERHAKHVAVASNPNAAQKADGTIPDSGSLTAHSQEDGENNAGNKEI